MSRASEVSAKLSEVSLKGLRLPSISDFNKWRSELKKAGASPKQLDTLGTLTDGLLDLFSEIEGPPKR